jgi:DNA repair exonuclease SbcCD nuclease subunit
MSAAPTAHRSPTTASLRLVHLSDLHLGYRQYQRLTPAGINQREADVAGTFRRAVEATIALAPDLVLIGGDVFHTVRPTNTAIMHAFRQFARLRAMLPGAEIVMVAGNHDTPRTAETGCILRLFADLGLHVVDNAPQRIPLPALGISVLAVPDVPGMTQLALDPDPAFSRNVLLLHGEVEGMLPKWAALADRAPVEISTEQLGAERWDYVALGHYHVYRRVAPNAYYSGSIEYTSANTWGELVEESAAGLPGKGLIEHDLATGTHRFHPLPPARALVDLPPLAGRGMNAADLDRAIRERVESVEGGIDEKIVRLVARDVPRHVARELDYKAIREYKRRALHFHLDARKPEIVRLSASGAPVRRPSLVETVEQRLRERPVDPGVNRDALVALGLHYLREADVVGAPAPVAAFDAGGGDAGPGAPAGVAAGEAGAA